MGSGGYNRENQNKIKLSDIKDEEMEKIYNSLPKDEYLCPQCGNIPELINIHTDNGYVEFKCRSHDELLLSVDQYFKKLYESKKTYYNIKCCFCNKIQNNFLEKDKIFQYCYECKKNFCFECYKIEEKHSQSHIKKCIPINAKKTRCPLHYDEIYTSFCQDCHENICETFSSKQHPRHTITNFFKIEDKKKIIIDKNKKLSNIIRFNELILNTYEKFPDNYYHNINVATLAESIILENSRDSRELETAFNQLQSKLKHRNEAIKEFNKKFKQQLKGIEKRLSLSKIGLNDEGLKCLTKINFPKLIEMDLSGNNIRDINCLKDLDLSNLNYLSLNDNKIEDIQVLGDINLEKLKILDLHNNEIKTFSPLLKNEFPCLDLIKVEGNKEIDSSLKDLQKKLEKYTKNFIYIAKTFDEFNKKYKLSDNKKISKESKIIDLNGKKSGNDVIKNLYIISSKYENVTKLDLSDCDINNISFLSRILFPNLEYLDLSVNKIKNIDNLPEMRIKKLKELYLNENEISNIWPIKYMNCPELETISLAKNSIFDNEEVQSIIKDLKNKNIAIQIDFLELKTK